MIQLTRTGSLGVLALLGVATAFAADPPASTPPPYAPLPNPVSSFGAIGCDGFVYVYGGHAGTAHVYNSQTSIGAFRRLPVGGGEKWEELPGGPGLIGVSIAAAGGKVYRVGGTHARNKPGEKSDLISVSDVAVYDPKAKAWATFPPLPAGRSSHDVVAVGEKLVVVGGWQMTGASGSSVWADTALVCDTAAKSPAWEPIPQPFKRRALAAAAVGSKVYVIGGLTESGESVRKVEILDLATRSWSSGPEFPGTERTGFNPAACNVGGRLYVNAMDRAVLRLTTTGDNWEKVGMTAEARYVHRLVPVGADGFVAIAGASPKGPHASVELVRVSGPTPAPATGASSAKAQKYCPVMTTDEVDPEHAVAVEYKGVKVFLCCDTCVARFRRDPVAYLDAKLIPGLAGMELPKREIEQVYCPVYPERKISAKDPFVMYQGVKVYVFNDVAKQRFVKDPTRYADPKILPQLPK
jgi:YHS domain-containing protein